MKTVIKESFNKYNPPNSRPLASEKLIQTYKRQNALKSGSAKLEDQPDGADQINFSHALDYSMPFPNSLRNIFRGTENDSDVLIISIQQVKYFLSLHRLSSLECTYVAFRLRRDGFFK
jgi:hypothetical protein